MTVYVDNARIPYRGMLMCHMFADSKDELHKMADAIGLKRTWFQRGSVLWHYDVCLTKRADAIRRGAVPVDRTWVKQRIRDATAGRLPARKREARPDPPAPIDPEEQLSLV